MRKYILTLHNGRTKYPVTIMANSEEEARKKVAFLSQGNWRVEKVETE